MMYYGNMTEEEFVDEAKRRYQTIKLSEDFVGVVWKYKFFFGEYNMISGLVKKDVGIDIRVRDVLETPSWEELEKRRRKYKIGEEYIHDLITSIREVRERTLKKLEALENDEKGQTDAESVGDCRRKES